MPRNISPNLSLTLILTLSLSLSRNRFIIKGDGNALRAKINSGGSSDRIAYNMVRVRVRVNTFMNNG
jgi:hypothetical protein